MNVMNISKLFDEHGFDHWYKRTPPVAQLRAEMAAFYRSMRRDQPKMARLLYKRERYCHFILSGMSASEARKASWLT